MLELWILEMQSNKESDVRFWMSGEVHPSYIFFPISKRKSNIWLHQLIYFVGLHKK